jgi:FAD/FMN-containing dehydrogenase
LHWAPVVILAGLYAGTADEGERALQPVSEMGTPIEDMSGRQRYVELQSELDPLFADGQLYYWKSLFADRLSDEVIDEIVALAAEKPSPQCLFALRALGGAMGRVPEEATAYGNRDALVNISLDNTWQDPARTDEMIDWTRAAWADLREQTGGGVYVNFAGFGEESDALTRAVHGDNHDRLRRIKARFDPDNFFRVNQNIEPAEQHSGHAAR